MAMKVGIPRDIGCREGCRDSFDFLDNDMVGRERQRVSGANETARSMSLLQLRTPTKQAVVLVPAICCATSVVFNEPVGCLIRISAHIRVPVSPSPSWTGYNNVVNTDTAIPHQRPRWTGQLLHRLILPPSTSRSMHPHPPATENKTGKLSNFFNSRLATTAKRPTTVPAPRDSQSPSQIRSRTGSAKTKGGMSDFGSDFFGSNRIDEIGTPNDPVCFTHLGFNTSSGAIFSPPKIFVVPPSEREP